MAKKFGELRAKMSPEAQARAAAQGRALIAKLANEGLGGTEVPMTGAQVGAADALPYVG